MTTTTNSHSYGFIDDAGGEKRSRLSKLPADFRVLSEADAAAYCGLSLVHFRRMRRDQKGPRYVQLTEKRVGYRFKDLLVWLEERVCL